ncbi:hypothetical protein MM213_08445 [Belliella sp. R4-6]|uniref:Anti-sigma factor n=1 Tax=Belliella alkalica TaxID=1730871 RepID=A0ABS9VAQ4_9BACT|nr:hypothetical protein [Belliella alkalica]MCH7413510.1 hypothetical protein [Belliella alkalica]
MKLQDDMNDKELEMFFSELRNENNKLTIPEYPKKPSSNFRKLIPIGIAASLLLGIFVWNQTKEETPLYQDLIIISLIEGEDNEQRFVIEQASSMDVWESPTASLLNEF